MFHVPHTMYKNNRNNLRPEDYRPQIKILGHASVVIYYRDLVIYVDPHSAQADFRHFRPADLILLTHDHFDHFDERALRELSAAKTIVIANSTVKALLTRLRPDLKVRMLRNGESVNFGNDIVIRAVPAYNIKNIRPDTGLPFHPKGIGNGYILEFPATRVYIAGDTELIPEMGNLGRIDVAILPMMHPFTLDGEEFIKAAKLINPKVLYPYHYERVERGKLRKELPGMDIR